MWDKLRKQLLIYQSNWINAFCYGIKISMYGENAGIAKWFNSWQVPFLHVQVNFFSKIKRSSLPNFHWHLIPCWSGLSRLYILWSNDLGCYRKKKKHINKFFIYFFFFLSTYLLDFSGYKKFATHSPPLSSAQLGDWIMPCPKLTAGY